MKRKYIGTIRGILPLLIFAGLLSISTTAAPQQEPAGAKTLFYDPAAKKLMLPKAPQPNPPGMVKNRPAPPRTGHTTARTRPVPPVTAAEVKNVGIHYWLERDGGSRVTEDTVFYTGDRVRFYIRSNVDGYFSLWTRTPTGGAQRLFPPVSEPNANNFIKAGAPYNAIGWIVFRPPAEDENLIIFFSRSQSEVPMGRNGMITGEEAQLASNSEGSKALSFEIENKDPETTGCYIVSPSGGAITRMVKLRHKARTESQ